MRLSKVQKRRLYQARNGIWSGEKLLTNGNSNRTYLSLIDRGLMHWVFRQLVPTELGQQWVKRIIEERHADADRNHRRR